MAAAQVGVETRRPAPDRVEHDPEQLLASIIASVDDTLNELGTRRSEVRAAGLATQRSSIVAWCAGW